MFQGTGGVVTTRESFGRDDGSIRSEVWSELRQHARMWADGNDRMTQWLTRCILEAGDLATAVSYRLATLYSGDALEKSAFVDLAFDVLDKSPKLLDCVCADLLAIRERDPATREPLGPFLFLKGFAAITCHRIAHHLWCDGSLPLALYLQHRVAAISGIDIHPGARVGRGVLLDHATGIVVGETAVIGDDVTLFHNVTLGGTGKERGDRHPKIDNGVLIGAAATLLGNIRIGVGARIGAGSVVLHDVPAGSIAVGNPATVKPTRIPTTTSSPGWSQIAQWA